MQVKVDVKNGAKNWEIGRRLAVNPILVETTGKFNTPIRTGNPLEFAVKLKGISGITQPLTGQLAVTSPQLNYQDIRTVTLQPMGDNLNQYAIPVPKDAPIGFYGVDVQFNIEGVNLESKQYKIYLPEAQLEFSLPGADTGNYTAGETITINMENTGGQPG